ncbi:MAG TPA: dipeptidase [Phycisphaerae bacterium]
MIDQVMAYIDEHRDEFTARLLEFLRIKSISTDATCKDETRQGAEWVRTQFERCGIGCDIVPTPRHPCVLADSGSGSNGTTVLLYGHYDVQPIIDLSLWKSPPFEPEIRDGRVFARGSADDKGQVLTHMLAAEAWMKVAQRLPVRVKYLIEGEEEIGSPNLADLIREESDRLACDYIVISDTAKLDENTPAITYGTKGLVYKEITVTGPANDVHSGSFGGTIGNPGNALCKIITSLKDSRNRVTIPGFYKDVRKPAPDERQRLSRLKFNEKRYAKSLGVPALEGEAGYSTIERRWVRPTLDVNGLFGGYQGPGSSTIIPAKVAAKVSMRLVPDQDPEKISNAFDKAVLAAAPKSVRVQIQTHGTNCSAYVAPTDTDGMRAALLAVQKGFNKRPVLIREGGTLPILPMFKKVLGADSIMMGFCLPNCNAHGPNEFFDVSDFHAGIRSAAYFLHELASR